jgi:hypothetical protein
MIHLEILLQYSEGQTTERIAQEVFGLSGILRDQPRKLGSKHFELLSSKLQMIHEFYDLWSGEGPPERRGHQERLNNMAERKMLMQNGFF